MYFLHLMLTSPPPQNILCNGKWSILLICQYIFVPIGTELFGLARVHCDTYMYMYSAACACTCSRNTCTTALCSQVYMHVHVLSNTKICPHVTMGPPPPPPVTKYYTTSQQVLISCILSVTALTLVSSVIATIISAGYPREKLEFLRHYSVFNIVSRKYNCELHCVEHCCGIYTVFCRVSAHGRLQFSGENRGVGAYASYRVLTKEHLCDNSLPD